MRITREQIKKLVEKVVMSKINFDEMPASLARVVTRLTSNEGMDDEDIRDVTHHNNSVTLELDDNRSVTIWSDGVQIWRQHDKIHRDDGPAVTQANGTQYWYQHGIRQQKDSPEMRQQFLSINEAASTKRKLHSQSVKITEMSLKKLIKKMISERSYPTEEPEWVAGVDSRSHLQSDLPKDPDWRTGYSDGSSGESPANETNDKYMNGFAAGRRSMMR